MSIYTMEQWQKDGAFKADPGQEVTAKVYEEMLSCCPPEELPATKARQAIRDYKIPLHSGFLMGEPHTCGKEGFLYLAFGKTDISPQKYYYLGLSTKKTELNGTYYYMDCMNAFVNDGLFPEKEFKDDQDAIKTAADYEATLYKYIFKNGEIVKTTLLYEPRFY